MKNIVKLTNYLILFLIIKCEDKFHSETLLDWGIKNKLYLSPFIETSLIDKKKNLKFIAKTDIPKNQELLKIPNALMFNISKVLELINIKTLNKQYKDFENLNLTNINYGKEKSFLSYILYLVNHKPRKYQKTKFFEFFQKFIEILGKFRPKTPLFYGPTQLELLAGTLLYKHLDSVKKLYEYEIKIFSGKTYYKKELDFDEYAQYKLSTCKYGMNISDQWTIVPFLNYFDDDYSISNANYTIEQNGDLKIYSLKEIKKGELIILQAEKKTNIGRLILEGKTNEELVDYFNEYLISSFSPGLYYKYGINDKDYFQNFYVNILERDFDKKLVKVYQKNAALLKGDGTEKWAYDIILLNLKFYKDLFEGITMDKIYDIYYDTDDRINIDRIIRGERKIIFKVYENIDKVKDILIEEVEIMKKTEKEINGDEIPYDL